MGTPGRKRKPDPTIPAHIDQAALPRGVYWDRSGNGRWFVFVPGVTGRRSRRTIGDKGARLSDLHRTVEELAGIDRGALTWLLDQFHGSAQFKRLADRTRADYQRQRVIASTLQIKPGLELGAMQVARLSQPFMQRVVDKLGSETPTKANHLHRYLRRVFHWGMNRGHCGHNPSSGVEMARERKRRRMPDDLAYSPVLAFATARGGYLWQVMELGFLCRLRGIETLTLTDANITKDGVLTNRRKGSRDNVVGWSPRLRAAVDAALARRADIWTARAQVIPFAADQRPLIVGSNGRALSHSGLSTCWQRMIQDAMRAGVITEAQRFSPHDLKRKGITETPGTRADKQHASGHRTESMLDTYDLSVPIVRPSKDG